MPESASVPSWALNRLFTNAHTTTCPESRIRHPYTHEKHGVRFRKSGNSCGALLGGNESSSAYPLMTLPVRRAVIRPSFASIADTLREEFANKGLRLYENIYVRVASRNRTLARFGDFDFSPSAVSTTPSAPFYKVSELYALAR